MMELTNSASTSTSGLGIDLNELPPPDVPDWVKELELARKLPANNGARIRRCVRNALEKNPPGWVKEILEHSISKEVFKLNASGQTKRAVLSVLDIVSGEGIMQQKKPDKGRE